MELNEEGLKIEELVDLRRETRASRNTSADEMNGVLSPISSWLGVGFDGLDSAGTPISLSSSIIDPSSSGLDLGDYYVQQAEREYSLSLLENEPMSMSMPMPMRMPMPPTFNNIIPNSITRKVKKVEGQPSKNLMAERRRRKRLNDRLSMLRSVVPKISKMDRTSILGDTIDYMKELLERISVLQQHVHVHVDDVPSNHFKVFTIFKDIKPNDVLVRNSPKFDVERKEMNTRIEICCTAKPGLLLSTVTALEALGLEIQQCVISCFNDFSLQASCSQGSLLGSEDIKQALFRNAGYGGRCL